MYRALCLAAFLVCVHAVDDFDVTYRGFEFIYHDRLNLLLTIHDNKCYFSHVYDGDTEGYYMRDHKERIELYIYDRIVGGYSHSIQSSSLDSVRDQFHDLLADFTCMDKDIYTFYFTFQSVHDHWYNQHSHHSHHNDN